MELYGLLNEKEKLTASLSAGVDYYKGDQGIQGEKGEDGARGNVIFTTTTPPDKTTFYIANLDPPFLAVDDYPPMIGDLILYESKLYLIKRLDMIKKVVSTTLYVDLKGEQGIGEQGEKGEDGSSIWTTESSHIKTSLNATQIRFLIGKEGLTPAVNDLIITTDNFKIYRINEVTDLIVSCDYIGCFQGEQGEQGIQGEKGEQGERGLQGYTFTPSVSSTGVISWSNDGGLPNPSSVDLVAAVISALPSAVGVNF